MVIVCKFNSINLFLVNLRKETSRIILFFILIHLFNCLFCFVWASVCVIREKRISMATLVAMSLFSTMVHQTPSVVFSTKTATESEMFVQKEFLIKGMNKLFRPDSISV